MILVLCVIVIALAFEFINGFHDLANAIASVSCPYGPRCILTQLTHRCPFGHAVAKTIGKGLVDINFVQETTAPSLPVSFGTSSPGFRHP